jgi:hypothetical protein
MHLVPTKALMNSNKSFMEVLVAVLQVQNNLRTPFSLILYKYWRIIIQANLILKIAA